MTLTDLAAAIAVALPSSASHPPPALTAALADWDRAQVSGNERELRRLIADDYVLVNSAGHLESKGQFISELTDPAYHPEPFVVREPVIRSWAGGAVAGGVALLKGIDGGQAFEACLRFADVWALRRGRWSLVFTQASRADPKACGA